MKKETISSVWSLIDISENTILRAETPGGPFTPITKGMIPDVGGSGKATYSFTDGDVELGKTYYYWLQDVDSRGRITAHQVIPVTVAEAKASGKSQENVSKEDNTTSVSLQTAATTGVVALQNQGPSSLSVTIEDGKGNVIEISRVEGDKPAAPASSALQVTEEAGRVILTWQGTGQSKGFVIHRSEKGKDDYTSLSGLIPYFGRDGKEIFRYRFIDKNMKQGIQYDYRLEVVKKSLTFAPEIYFHSILYLGHIFKNSSRAS
ncbi:MAG: hypothetical protein HZA12_00105 [Nitrospirae bacterium]|nr:hypothetical protein [Nitrospirota bacterium]